MAENFGARLRQRREDQHIALGTIAEQTKIKLSLLEALERDDVSHWPSGIFRRAFIRTYAEAIGLNPDVVVREFFEVHPEPPEVLSPWTDPKGAGDETFRTGHGPPTRLRYLVGSAIESLARRRRPSSGEVLALGSRSQPVAPPPVEADVADLPALPDPPAPELDPPAAAEPALPAEPAPPELDLGAVAHLCTELGRAAQANDVQPLLAEAVRILDATGLIVWVWDADAAQLRPALVHGYSARVLAQLPAVGRDANNATAAAFRSVQPRAISGRDHVSGALVIPLLTPTGCSGVLAIELHNGREQSVPVRAVATILAAMLAQLVGARPAEVLSESVRASS
jgi:transcriptional regulator with XRE-family HTH domain